MSRSTHEGVVVDNNKHYKTDRFGGYTTRSKNKSSIKSNNHNSKLIFPRGLDANDAINYLVDKDGLK